MEPTPGSSGQLGPVRAGHDAWYKREVERGRRFHGAFSGGHSAGYFNTVGSEEGWQPSSFVSSRRKRGQVEQKTAADFADEEDGLLGASLEISGAYDDGRSASKSRTQQDALAELLSVDARLEGTRAKRMLRLLSRRETRDRGEAPVLETPTPSIALKSDRYCVGYEGFVRRASAPARERRTVYRVSDLTSGLGLGLEDDDDDVFAAPTGLALPGHDRRKLLAVVDEEDDDDDGPLALPSRPRMLGGRPEGRLRAGEPLPGFTRALVRETTPALDLPDPPRGWRPRHVFVEPAVPSPWRRLDTQPALRPATVARMRAGDQDRIATGFAKATGSSSLDSRFAKATTVETFTDLAPGLHRASDLPEPKKARLTDTARPATWDRRPTRVTQPWQPLPLLCRRFALPEPKLVPVASSRVASSRSAAPAPVELEPPPAAPPPPLETPFLLEPPDRPDLEIFKAIFDAVDDDPPPAPAPTVAPPAPAESPPRNATERDVLDDLLDAPRADPHRDVLDDLLGLGAQAPPPPPRPPEPQTRRSPDLPPERREDDAEKKSHKRKKKKHRHKKKDDKKKKKKRSKHRKRRRSSSSSSSSDDDDDG